MRRFIVYLLISLALSPLSAIAEVDSLKVTPTDTLGVESEAPPAQNTVDRVIVYYLHSNRRCATCKKLEAYSEEAVTAGFADQLEDSLIIWQVLNFEDEHNEHFVKDYGLYTQSLVLSRLEGDEEVEWKNLEKIWTLVGDKTEFMAYVQGELKAFLNAPEEQDG